MISRVSESDRAGRAVREAIRFFSSREGERIEECSCSSDSLDAVTVCASFVENIDMFVDTMDRISNGAFLRGDENGLGDEWVELDWLKAKGYYGIEAFVGNRLEVALRLSWMNFSGGKKRGVKLKEKMNAAGVAANVYWRKKGCVDWWGKLDAATRRRIYLVVLGKTAKPLTAEILKIMKNSEDCRSVFTSCGESSSWFKDITSLQRTNLNIYGADGGIDLTGKPSSLANMLNGLFILQNISAVLLTCQHSEFDQENVLFSSLASITSMSDCLYRKMRGLLMAMSLDCTKLELFEEENSKIPTKKGKEKVSGPGRKKKGGNRKGKRSNPVLKSFEDDSQIDTPSKDQLHEFVHDKNVATTMSAVEVGTISVNILDRALPSPMEHGEGFVKVNSRTSRKGRKRSKEAKNGLTTDPAEVQESETRSRKAIPSISQSGATEGNGSSENSFVRNMSDCVSTNNYTTFPKLSPSTCQHTKLVQSNKQDCITTSVENGKCGGLGESELSNQEKEEKSSYCSESVIDVMDSSSKPPLVPIAYDNVICNEDNGNKARGCLSESDSCPEVTVNGMRSQEGVNQIKELKGRRYYNSINSLGCRPYEWPSVAPTHLSSVNSHPPHATDRLHLDVGYNQQNYFHKPFVPTVHQVRNRPTENGRNQILSQPLPMSLDWPLMVRNSCGFPVTYSYDSGYMARRQSSFHQGFSIQNMQHNATASDDERIYTGDYVDLSNLAKSYELTDEHENQYMSEEEYEAHTVSEMDYSQYFGGGAMYWNTSEHPANNFSRPPSLSSDDSSWAWREADMNRTVDDMVAFSSSYSTNGLASPSATSFCSPFDPLVPGVGFVIQGSEVAGKLLHSTSAISDLAAEESGARSFSSLPSDGEGKTQDALPYPILRPIIIPNISRERSRSEFKRSHPELRSPCVPLNRREHPRIKRPPSPVVLCVPHAPRPPPPSPVGDPRKHRGFLTVRSGSSSPRHWGMRGLLNDNFEESCVRVDGIEVVWPSWRNKTLPAHGMIQPIPGTLLQDRLIALSHLTHDQEHPDVKLPVQPPEALECQTSSESLSLMYSALHDEIDAFSKQVAAKNIRRKPYINWAVKRVARSLQVLWPRSRTNIFGSYATGLSLPTSDVDLVVCLPPVRNLEPIKEAGILEGRNGIKETCLQHAARYLANLEWVKNDSLKIVENTAIPIIMLVVEVPWDFINSAASTLTVLKEESVELPNEETNPLLTNMINPDSSQVPTSSELNNGDGKDMKSIRIDISFKSSSHTGLQTTELVKELTEQFPATIPLALVLKQFLADRSLDQSYSGGLSSYCLVLLITRFLQHEHHLGRPINQNFGSLLMDFFYFFGNVFDPRQMRISVRGSGIYINRERGCSIDPIYIDDPLFPANNVGRNCFRIHQCIKAFADAYSTFESEQNFLPDQRDSSTRTEYNLLQKIIPSIFL